MTGRGGPEVRAGAGLHWYIARHYLGAGRRRGLLSLITWIALGGVTLGVSALVIVIAVMAGMQEDLRSKILESTPHVLVLERGSSLRLTDWEAVIDTALSVDGVVAAAPFVLSQVSVVRGGTGAEYAQPASLFGVSLDTTRAAPTEMESNIGRGVLDLARPPSGLDPILLGRGLADRMQLFEGDTVAIIAFENLRPNVFGVPQPALGQFEVTGTFATGMYDYDTQNLYVSLESAQELLGLDRSGQVSGVGVRTRDPELATLVADELESRLGHPYVVESWMSTNSSLFNALKLEKLAMTVILFLIVVVAAFNIVSTLVMVVADRTREIGILKAMGMTRQGILRVFVLQGVWIGAVGTLVGTALGLWVCWLQHTYHIVRIPADVYFVDHLPVSVEPLDMLTIVGGSLAVALVATIYPALQASRLEPVDAIRHE